MKLTYLTHLHKLVLAGVLSTLASLSCAEVIDDGNGLYYHLPANGTEVQFTYLANDSTNATAYCGNVAVPDRIIHNAQWFPVKGVTALACAGCYQLESIELPEGITRIGLGAFSECTGLQQVKLPASLTEMQDVVFYADSSLTQVELPASVSRLGAGTFAYCTRLDSVAMEWGLRSIASQAFYYCTSLRSVSIPGSVSAIGEYAFAYCVGLEQVVMAGSPIAVTSDAFQGVEVENCRLVVPSDQIDAYREAEVWRDFLIVDGGYEDIREVERDDVFDAFTYRVEGEQLVLTVAGDAPALVYDMSGRRIAIVPSHSTETSIHFSPARIYIIRCGRKSVKVSR